MTIFVNTLVNTISVDVTSEDTISILKTRIFNKTGVPADNTRLILGGSVLEEWKTLSSYGIKQESTVKLVQGKARRVHRITLDDLPTCGHHYPPKQLPNRSQLAYLDGKALMRQNVTPN